MSRIFFRISSWSSLIRRSASTSCAQRFSMIGTGPLPKMSRWKMSERLACGSTEKRRTRLPWRASQKALVAERVVFPSPPLPPNMTYRRSGWLSNTCLSDMTSPFYRVRAPGLSPRPHPAATTQGDPASARSEVVSTEDVGHVALAQHPALPARDLRRHVGQEPQRVVRRQDRHAQEVAHRDQDEQVLHARPRAHRVPGHLVGGHAVDDVLEDAQDPALLLRLRRVRHELSPLRGRAGRTRASPRTPGYAPCAVSTSRSPARRTGAA